MICKKLKSKLVLFLVLDLLFYCSSAMAVQNRPQLLNKLQKIRNEKLLKLTLNIFLASKDLKNAYLVAKVGYKRYPDNIFWLKELAKICLWTGKEKEAMNLYLKLYKKTGQSRYRKTAFNLATALNRFDIAKQILKDQIHRGKFPPLHDLIYVYQQAGYPFELIDILEKRYASTKDIEILEALVPILWSCGMIDKAISKLKEIEKIKGLSVRQALLYSEMLYAKRKFKSSLLVLKRYMNRAKKTDVEFWKTLSDLAWAQREYEISAKASHLLYEIKKARAVDYERLYLYYYSQKKYLSALNYAIEGYRRYKKDYLFYGFLTIAEALKRWDLILKQIKRLKPKDVAKFRKNVFFVISYATSLIKTGNLKAGKRLIEETLEKDFSCELLIHYIYTLLDLGDTKRIKLVVKKYSKQAKLFSELAIPFAACYLYLQDGRQAINFIQKALLKDHKTMLLKAEILSLFGKEQEAEKIRFLVWKEMKTKLIKNKERSHDTEFLKDFLRLAIKFESSRSVYKYLKIAEKKLSKSDILSIRLSYLISIGEKQKARFLIRKKKHRPDPWISLSLCMSDHDKYLVYSALKKNKDKIPLRDMIPALKMTGQIGKAMNTAFRGLNRNWYNSSFWEQLTDLIQVYGNKVSLHSHYIERGGYREIKEEQHLKLGMTSFELYFINKAEIRLRQSSDTVINAPKFMNEFSISGLKVSSRYSWRFCLGIIDSVRTRPFLGIDVDKRFLKNTTLKAGFGINKRADETLLLYIGGMKDQLYLQFIRPFLRHLTVNLNAHYHRYHAQDNNYLGYNFGVYSELVYVLRWGYPDLGAKLYIQHESYNEKGKDKGVINHLSPYKGGAVLPDTFNQAGLGVFLGYENRERFTKSWRPFFKLDTTINDQTGVGLSIESGISTPFVIGHDNITVSINYIRGFRGTEDNYYDCQIKWRRFF